MKTKNTVNYYSGTSGLVLPVRNKQAFPPEFQNKTRLCYYGSLFNSIEINSSFYKIPMAATVSKWTTEVPPNFRFTFKLWREITHNKGLAFRMTDVEKFMYTINQAGDKKGCLLIQFPPSIKSDNVKQLEHLLTAVHMHNPVQWDVAVEFRHSSWYNEPVYDLLEQYAMGLIIHDMPSSAAPLKVISNDFVYLRFHGPGGNYRGCYTDDFLHEYAQYISEWQSEGKTVYVYFNNTMGDAVQNLMSLNRYVAANGAG
ncbi:DUF72 domain-containing protein [Mucilaginibacter paludis]|uniref:DUF72 domain-containing protein n=1 Tax=Mucilaginibacter paludis DSM 18603 TaxID=714943 RepID=H1Y8W5_9SPHI|nr:DUF72 domain-containing protein [Mucilaginibacter paludis]EHQ28731.1 protein of unknown function DUF72 [Mucilaginibacter paludis DSM 18603]